MDGGLSDSDKTVRPADELSHRRHSTSGPAQEKTKEAPTTDAYDTDSDSIAIDTPSEEENPKKARKKRKAKRKKRTKQAVATSESPPPPGCTLSREELVRQMDPLARSDKIVAFVLRDMGQGYINRLLQADQHSPVAAAYATREASDLSVVDALSIAASMLRDDPKLHAAYEERLIASNGNLAVDSVGGNSSETEKPKKARKKRKSKSKKKKKKRTGQAVDGPESSAPPGCTMSREELLRRLKTLAYSDEFSASILHDVAEVYINLHFRNGKDLLSAATNAPLQSRDMPVDVVLSIIATSLERNPIVQNEYELLVIKLEKSLVGSRPDVNVDGTKAKIAVSKKDKDSPLEKEVIAARARALIELVQQMDESTSEDELELDVVETKAEVAGSVDATPEKEKSAAAIETFASQTKDATGRYGMDVESGEATAEVAGPVNAGDDPPDKKESAGEPKSTGFKDNATVSEAKDSATAVEADTADEGVRLSQSSPQSEAKTAADLRLSFLLQSLDIQVGDQSVLIAWISASRSRLAKLDRQPRVEETEHADVSGSTNPLITVTEPCGVTTINALDATDTDSESELRSGIERRRLQDGDSRSTPPPTTLPHRPHSPTADDAAKQASPLHETDGEGGPLDTGGVRAPAAHRPVFHVTLPSSVNPPFPDEYNPFPPQISPYPRHEALPTERQEVRDNLSLRSSKGRKARRRVAKRRQSQSAIVEQQSTTDEMQSATGEMQSATGEEHNASVERQSAVKNGGQSIIAESSSLRPRNSNSNTSVSSAAPQPVAGFRPQATAMSQTTSTGGAQLMNLWADLPEWPQFGSEQAQSGHYPPVLPQTAGTGQTQQASSPVPAFGQAHPNPFNTAGTAGNAAQHDAANPANAQTFSQGQSTAESIERLVDYAIEKQSRHARAHLRDDIRTLFRQALDDPDTGLLKRIDMKFRHLEDAIHSRVGYELALFEQRVINSVDAKIRELQAGNPRPGQT